MNNRIFYEGFRLERVVDFEMSATEAINSNGIVPTTQTPSELLKKFTTPSGVQYENLIKSVNIDEVTSEQISRVEKLSGKKVHPFLSRHIFFAHLRLNEFLDDVEAGRKTYVLVQLIPNKEVGLTEFLVLSFAKYLQEALNQYVVVQVLDDYKVIQRESTPTEAQKLSNEIIKYVIAFGFDTEKTFVFTDYSKFGMLYRTVSTLQKATPCNSVQSFFNFETSDNTGKYSYPAVLAAPMFAAALPEAFADSARCLVLDCIIKAEFYNTLSSIADTIQYTKPSVIFFQVVPQLGGVAKCDAITAQNMILLSDNQKEVERKINKVAFSGGRDTMEEHRRLGGQCDIDVSFQYIRFFSNNDEEVNEIQKKYSKGEMLTGELKKLAVGVMKGVISSYQEKKKPVTNAVLKEFNEKMNNWSK